MTKTKVVATYQSISGAPQLLVLRKNNARMAAIELKDNSLCIISPVKGLEMIEPGSRITYVLAPNHYHNKGLSAFHEMHPRAQLCASKAARTRLEEQTGLAIRPLTGLTKKLPIGFTILEPEGLKTGEIWIRFKTNQGTGWLVTDAFCGKAMTAKSEQCKSPELLSTFPKFGIGALEEYRNWVLNQIEHDQPTIVVPCHGSVISDKNLSSKLSKLVARL